MLLAFIHRSSQLLTVLLLGVIIVMNAFGFLKNSMSQDTGERNESSVAHLTAEAVENGSLQGKDDKYWKEKLTPLQHKVCRRKGTERAFTGRYNDFKGDGSYHCSVCGNELFSSEHKFDSGTGWPSYTEPVHEDAVDLHPDRSWGITRVEVVCNRCESHLGHVFDDGPAPTGMRYCINSVCLVHEEHLPTE